MAFRLKITDLSLAHLMKSGSHPVMKVVGPVVASQLEHPVVSTAWPYLVCIVSKQFLDIVSADVAALSAYVSGFTHKVFLESSENIPRDPETPWTHKWKRPLFPLYS